MPDQPRIFISYSRKDGEIFATDLRKKLIAIFGEDQLWQDRAKMEGGVGWWSQIEEALEAVEFMVLVATPEAMQSPIVAKEWRRARQEGVCVYPVQVPGLPIDFNALPRWMADSHFYNLDKEWDTFVNYLKSPCNAVKVPFMPPPLPEHFVERPAEFNALRDLLLDADRQNPLAITTALKGAGGFGKTTLAAALCHDEAVQTAFDDGILWATLGEQPDVLGALTKLYAALTGERPAFVDAEDAANNLADKLADRDCLIVIDDAWNTAHLRPFLRGGERCARLITTRIMDVALEAEAQPLTVDEMETDEAAQMLLAGIKPAPTDPEPFRRLAQRLGEWPLALKLANGALRKRILRRDTPEKAARWLEDELRTDGVQVLKSDDANQRGRSAGATLEITFQMLDEPERIDLRHRFTTLGVFYEDTDIPLTALAALWGCSTREAERYATRLDDLSLLLRLDLESGTIRLHDVIRQYALSQLTDVNAQHARLLDGWGDPYALPDTFAWTWYIYHLREAGRDLNERLLDFSWLRAKLLATNPNALLADFDLALSPVEGQGVRLSKDDHKTLLLLQSAVRMSLHVLAADPRQLPAQLNGRLAHHRTQPAIAQFLDSLEPLPGTYFPINTHPTHLPAGGALLRTLSGHSGAVSGATALPDGRFLSWAGGLGSTDHTLRLWANDGSPITALAGHSESVDGALALPDGRFLSWSYDHTLRLWANDVSSITSLEGHSSYVFGAIALPDGRFLSWSRDTTLRLWTHDGLPLASLDGHS
ncbi:MAG: TIR domain-containing protein, partial [Anaerolineae bacterium]|nr:TIR domain-containing protein [Anaerolineae bacterium]